jgi:hypothetical protein
VAKTYGDLPFTTGWIDNNSNLTFSYAGPVASSVANEQFRLASVDNTSPLTVKSPITVTGSYMAQFKVIFAQTGLNGTATGTVVTVADVAKTYGDLPFTTGWIDNNSNLTFSYAGPVASSVANEQFRLASVTGKVSPMTVTGPENVTGNYVIQYLVTFEQTGSAAAPTVDYTVDTYPTVDSWVELTNPNTNHGSDQTLHVRVNWDSTNGIVTNLRRTYLKFDLSSLPSGTVIDSAILHIFRSGDEDVPSVYSTTDNWTESGITWNNQPGSVDFVGNGVLEVSSWIHWDITSHAGSEFDGDKVLSVVLRFDSESGLFQHADFTSREGTLNLRPWLEIFYKHKVTSDNIGLDNTATGIVVTVGNATKTYADLPFSIWIDNGASVTYRYENVSSSVLGKRFILDNVTGPLSPITVTGPTTVIGNYKTQYYLTVKTDPENIATIPGEGWYDAGTLVTLTAPFEPKIPYLVAYWKVDGENFPYFKNVIEVQMDASHTATAVYKDYLGHAKEEIEGLRAYLTNLYTTGKIGKKEYEHFMKDLGRVESDIDKAIKNLDTQRAGYDDKMKGFDDLRRAVMKLEHIINDVQGWAKKGKIPATDATWIINELETIRMKLVHKAWAEALTEKALALKAIAEAKAQGKDTTRAEKEIAMVDWQLAQAIQEINEGNLAQAIQHFKHAFAHSQFAVKKAYDPAWDIDYNDWIDQLEVMDP